MSVIVIDELAAKEDIAKIERALPELFAAKSALEKVREEGYTTKGETGKAIVEKADELIERINRLIKSLRNTAVEINTTVQQNQSLDNQMLQGFMNIQ